MSDEPDLGDAWLDVPGSDPASTRVVGLRDREIAFLRRQLVLDRWVYRWRMFITESRSSRSLIGAVLKLSRAVEAQDRHIRKGW